MLNPEETYHRKKQILYDSKNKKILTFIDKMPDAGNFTGELIINMNNYIKRYPERVDIFNMENLKTQLTLF